MLFVSYQVPFIIIYCFDTVKEIVTLSKRANESFIVDFNGTFNAAPDQVQQYNSTNVYNSIENVITSSSFKQEYLNGFTINSVKVTTSMCYLFLFLPMVSTSFACLLPFYLLSFVSDFFLFQLNAIY